MKPRARGAFILTATGPAMCVAGGFCAACWGRSAAQDPASLIFGTGPQGKPFLQNAHIAFNLSHSRDLAVLALSQSGPLGIDLEFIDRQVDIAGLAQSCFTPQEAAVLAALAAPEQAARFFAFWTAKEARMKLQGKECRCPHARLRLICKMGIRLDICTPETPAAQAIFLDLGQPAAICCLALPQGPRTGYSIPQLEECCRCRTLERRSNFGQADCWRFLPPGSRGIWTRTALRAALSN